MHLYDCSFDTFIPLATSGRIADILGKRFSQRMDQNPSPSEFKSWKNSLGAFAEAVEGACPDDAWMILEYQLPLCSLRVDSMIVGADTLGRQRTVLMEFKQWDRCEPTPVPEVVNVGGTEMLHPCAQVRDYRRYLEDAHSAFSDGHVQLSSCSYLHNVRLHRASGFFDSRYSDLLEDSPAFCLDTVDELSHFVGDRARLGADSGAVQAILTGGYKPSRRLLDYVAQSIDDYEPWRLLDDQRLAFNKIFGDVQEACAKAGQKVVVVTGGPGTGKSVIALQVVGAAARKGYGVVHATGSKAFTTSLRGIVGRREPFSYFNGFTKAASNSIDLVVCDEAHRLRSSSESRFHAGSGRPQVGEIVDSAKVAVFLLDENQSVRANEVGSVRLIEDYARRLGIPTSKYDLKAQFRCAGSDSYVRWIDHLLGFSPNRALAWKNEREYDARAFDSVAEMETALTDRIGEGSSARLVAGFCWPWSDPDPDGSLPDDVRVGPWAKPWNKKPADMRKKGKGSAEPPGRHPYLIWATQAKGFEQVGCIYSAQGFEFDYVGVIWGPDLRWDTAGRCWVADLESNYDQGFKNGLARERGLALDKLKHIYRVLSTRGMKGTYFYFLDRATRAHFEAMGGTPDPGPEPSD